MKLTGTNDQIMAMAAHRYCMGRASYAAGSCMEWIRATWAEFEPNTQSVMLRDTLQELTKWPDTPYATEWIETAIWMWDRMTVEQRRWVTDAVRHVDGAMLLLKPNDALKPPCAPEVFDGK